MGVTHTKINRLDAEASYLLPRNFSMLTLIGASHTTFAQSGGKVTGQGSTTAPSAGDTLKISPLRTDLTASPGQSAKVTVYIQNLSNSP
jgi:hypothetical protein